MPSLCEMGQMMFTKYVIVVDDNVDVHNTSEFPIKMDAGVKAKVEKLIGGAARVRNGGREQPPKGVFVTRRDFDFAFALASQVGRA